MKLSGTTYKSYKESSVLWAKEIPSHWLVEKGKWLFHKNEREVRKEDEVVTCFRDGEVTLRKNRRLDGFTNSLKEHGYQGIRKGDLVIHGMDAFAGSIGISDSEGKSTPVYNVLTERFKGQIDLEYYCYLFRYLAHSNFILSLAKGIRERSTDFRFSDIAKLEYVLPPKPEQIAISNFLDDKTAKIDQAIAQKQRMIELLQERKQIIIQNAVTKGLDSNVKMKDSGVECIGKIPEHWEVKKLKYVARINCNALGEDTDPNLKFNYVDIGSVSFVNGIERTEKFLFKSAPSRARRVAKKGDTIISTVRTYLKAIDFITSSKSKNIYSTGFAVLEPIKTNKEYLFHFVKSNAFTNQVMVNSKGMSYPAINGTELGRMYITIPNKDEQKIITAYIKKCSSLINDSIEILNREILKLKEYKTTLIDNAVTGKIKVS